MATANSATPVKVPAAAATYSAATQDMDLRSQINSLLINDGHVQKIQDHLLHALHANNANWPTLIQTHALSLLRSGEVHSFPALLNRVLEDVRQDTALLSSSNNTTNGNDNKKANGNGNSENRPPNSLALPQVVVDEALKVTREELEVICGIENDDGEGN